MVGTCGARITRTFAAVGGALLLLIATGWLAPPAAADLYSASGEYKKGDYAHALPDYLALAQLGEPQAQFNVAVMYWKGQGAAQSDIHAYAWAMLAAQSGDAKARKLADEIRPRLAPGSERIAGWITAPYTSAALSQRLMPAPVSKTLKASMEYRKGLQTCRPASIYSWAYPEDAAHKGIQGDVFVAFTVRPDGRARNPRVILEVPEGVFGDASRKGILRETFAPLPGGSGAIPCVIFLRYVDRPMPVGYLHLNSYVGQLRKLANTGDPNSQLLYGMALVGLPQLKQSSAAGLPWFVKAAQAGLPLAQFEVGFSLLSGIDCRPEEGKAIEWLRMAADQNEPNAEVTLAMGALRGSAGFGDAAQARRWLEKAAAQGNHEGELYLSALLAAAPDPHLRDPHRALELLQKAFDELEDDPTPFDIQAAAQAAEGDFPSAVKSEKKAIRSAHFLGWDLSPLQARLAAYQAHKPWYGDLVGF